ncbi:MAG: CotH kinase family protein [Nitrospirae bacterium]|nr:CotH kinase family protein [Candidatus Troglogloeales bacterium]
MQKRILLFIVGLLAVTSLAMAAEAPVTTLDLEMAPLDAEVLFKKEPYDTSTFPVAIAGQGTRMTGSVEVTGQSTRNFLKKSILIKLDGEQTWQGNKKIALRSMATDGSYMREWLTWNLLSSLGTVSPRVEYVKLNINQKYIGLFLFIEWIDTSLFDRVGLGKDGLFYHTDDTAYCGDMTPANQNRLEACWFKFSPKDRDYTPLRKLIEGINATPADQFDRFLTEHFDVDSVINWLVTNTLISNGDTYNKNYFLYLSQKTNKWVVIPWDFDLTFGRNADPILPFPRNLFNDNYQYFYPPELGSPNPLKEKTLQNAQLFQRFKKRISHVLGVTMEKETPGGFAWFRPDLFQSRVTTLEQIIGRGLLDELYPRASGAPFAQQVEALALYNQWRHPLLKKMILDPTPFNTAHWLPYMAFPSLTPLSEEAQRRRQTVPLFLSVTADIQPNDRAVVMVEELLARPVGVLDIQALNKPARVRLEVETERTPESVPPGMDPLQCVQRSWYLDLKTPDALMKVNLQLDYLRESSLRHELGDHITDERDLSLWILQDNVWSKLKTTVNPIAKVLKAQGLQLVFANVIRLVACEG